MIRRIALTICLIVACIWCLVSVSQADTGMSIRPAEEIVGLSATAAELGSTGAAHR